MTFHTKPLERHRLIVLICEGLFEKKKTTNKQTRVLVYSLEPTCIRVYANEKKTRVHNNVFYPSIKLQCFIWSCLLIRNIKHTNRNRKCMILHCLYTFTYLSNEWLCMFHLGSELQSLRTCTWQLLLFGHILERKSVLLRGPIVTKHEHNNDIAGENTWKSIR